MKKTQDSKVVMVCAGGTGGHVMPAISVYENLKKQGLKVFFVTDPRGARYTQDIPFTDLITLPIVRHQGVLGLIPYAFSLIMNTIHAFSWMSRHKASCLISFGGYVAFPMNMAAVLKGVPLVLHEQNAILGRVNRLFSRFSSVLALSFEAASRGFSTKALVTGVPVRQAIARQQHQDYIPSTGQDVIHILVLGGSQGAEIFSRVVPKALAQLPEKLHKRVRITLQGSPDALKEGTHPSGSSLQGEAAPFFRDVDVRMAQAHFVICRAGASTVAEVTLLGRPTLFVPYPFAMANHQRFNALAVVDQGGGWICDQKNFTPEWLSAFLEKTLQDSEGLLKASKGMRAQGHPDSATRLSDVVMAL